MMPQRTKLLQRTELLQRSVELAMSGTPLVQVTLIEATGSTPQETGAKMLVTAEGLEAGTVGGGRVEAKAIEHARRLLREKGDCSLVDWSLKTDVGMTCGGRVQLFFEHYGEPGWSVVIFGAGHVTQALTRLLVALPCRVTCIDPRADWLAKLPDTVHKIETNNPPTAVPGLSGDTFLLCMTRGHQSDLPVLEQIFRSERTFPYVGVIGSRAKGAVLRKELLALGLPKERLEFHCPVGLPLGSNAPSEIAVSIAAQLLEVRDALRTE